MPAPFSVLITGANRGLGLEMVRQLTKLPESPSVIVATYRSADSAAELLSLAKCHKSIRPLQFEVRDESSYPVIVDRVAAVVGDKGLNLLINNAGIYKREGFETETRENLLETYEVNSVVPVLLTRAFVPLLRLAARDDNGAEFTWARAAVINISSLLGSIGNTSSGGSYAYRMSKAAVNMATKCLSCDLKNDKILVVSVHPGWVQTDMGTSAATLKVQESISSILSALKGFSEKENGQLIDYLGQPMAF